MKKLMKKKVNVFGKTLSIFAIVMVAAIGLTSAALVGFLSNTVSADATVDMPFDVFIANGLIAETGSPLVVDDDNGAFSKASPTTQSLKGGETFETTIKFVNLANVDFENEEVTEVITISAIDPNTGVEQAFSCDDFSKIEYRTCTEVGNVKCVEFPASFDDITSLCESAIVVENSVNTIVIKVPNDYSAHEINIDQLKLTLKVNAIGIYQIDAKVIPTIII